MIFFCQNHVILTENCDFVVLSENKKIFDKCTSFLRVLHPFVDFSCHYSKLDASPENVQKMTKHLSRFFFQ